MDAETLERKILGDVFSTVFDQKLIVNTMRGLYVEALVAELLGSDWQLVSKDYSNWDLEHVSGLRGEVKQSAALQTWKSKNPSPRTFDIAPRKFYWEGYERIKKPGRFANVYFLCWHGCLDRNLADQRRADQWKFSIVNSKDLPPNQKKISVKKVLRLYPPISYLELEKEAAARLSGL